MTGGRWPLVEGSARLIPAGRMARDGGRVHLGRDEPDAEVRGMTVATFCGRLALSLGVEVDLEVLGADRDRLWCGSTMIEDVPFGRVRPLHQRVARQITAAIGGTVRTALLSSTTVMVYSPLLIDAKTEDQEHQELRAAMVRLWASEERLSLGQPDWRRRWSQVVSTPGR